MVPKNFRNNINILPVKIGPERREEILYDIVKGEGLLPKGVNEEDMDTTFVEFVKNELEISIDGKKVPVLFLTIQRWSEFTKTWNYTDKFKDIQIPFITIVRNPDIQIGTNQAGNYNIPGHRTYTYLKVPTWDGIRKGTDLYKIPQPTSVDITYQVRFFTNKMKDLNTFNSVIQRKFQSRQAYIFPNNHPMPVHLENISDESKIDDFEDRRFYVQNFEMLLLGYLLNPNDFEIIPTINRVFTTIELDENRLFRSVRFDPIVRENDANFSFVFKPKSDPEFTFTSQYDLSFSQLSGIENINNIKISVNGVSVFDGLTLNGQIIIIKSGDVINVLVNKTYLSVGKFQLIGNTI